MPQEGKISAPDLFNRIRRDYNESLFAISVTSF
jgi:hypothetical protein